MEALLGALFGAAGIGLAIWYVLGVPIQLLRLSQRVKVLETQVAKALLTPQPARPAAPVDTAPSIVTTPHVPARPQPTRHEVPVVPSPVVETPVAPPPTPPAPLSIPAAAGAAPVVTHEQVRPAAAAAAAQPPDGWEVRVGTNWLNKIGVVVFVMGVALLVGYSMVHVGAAGRVAIGYAASLTMLAGGVTLERRDLYRAYAHGLVAGGWAGIYFTTYAMHAVPAAHVIDSDTFAAALLVCVAGAMIAHSLRYASEVVTSLAYVAAYGALLVTPLSGFSMAASIPLTVSAAVVASRYGWSRVSLLCAVAAYGLFAMRGAISPEETTATGSLTERLLTLVAYWLTFEAGDILSSRSRRWQQTGPNSMFALNAIGWLGAMLLEVPKGDASLPYVLGGTGLAYLASAVIRLRLARAHAPADAVDTGITSAHVAVAMAAALVAWSIDLRFDGNARTIALLFETQLIFAAGMTTSDRRIRIVAVGVAALTVFRHADVWHQSPSPWTYIAALVAGAWFANREWIERRRVAIGGVEYGYSIGAVSLITMIIGTECAPLYRDLAGLALALVLVEIGVRRLRECVLLSYIVGALAMVSTLLAFGPTRNEVGVMDVLSVLPASIALTYAMAWRLGRGSLGHADPNGARVAAGFLLVGGTAMFAVVEWRIVSAEQIGGIWALTGLAFIAAGMLARTSAIRWQGFWLLALGMLRAVKAITARGDLPWPALGWVAVTIGACYAASFLARRRVLEGEPGDSDNWDEAARVSLSVAATLLLTGLLASQVRPTLVTLAWGLEGALLLGVGFPARERALRISGLVLLLVCVLKLFVLDLSELEALARILSFVVLGLVLLAVSWIYTRYKDRIRRLL